MITVPHRMSRALRKRLHGESFDEFADRLTEAADALAAGLKGVKACRPLARVLQRRYKTQRSVPVRDALVDFDLRTVAGGQDPALGRPVKKQSEWAELAYGLLSNKRSNMQFQIGVQFDYSRFGELADGDADEHFMAAFKAVRPFVAPVIA